HRQQQAEDREIGGELGDGEDDRKRPEGERAFQDPIVADPYALRFLESLEALDLCPRVDAFVRRSLEGIYLGARISDQSIEIGACGLDLVLHFDAHASPPL